MARSRDRRPRATAQPPVHPPAPRTGPPVRSSPVRSGPAPCTRLAPSRRGVVPVLALLLSCTALVAGWFATGHASAPDHGLLQLDVLSLDEPVAGLQAVGGRPTMVVFTCPQEQPPVRTLDPAYGLTVSTDPALARAVALPRATACEDGYVLLDARSHVRYRSYDPGWPEHAQEQEILLEDLDGHHGRDGT